MTVSIQVARFLNIKFGYNLPSLYVYDEGEQKFSIEPSRNPIPAPTVIEAVEFLWGTGIQIYNIPDGKESRGIIQVGDKRVEMKETRKTPIESFNVCLEFLSRDGH